MNRCLLKLFCFFSLILFRIDVNAADVDTVSTYSKSMRKEIKAVIITPEHYSTNKRYPVVYLLHGYSGNYSDWIIKVPEIKQWADVYNFIIVCADGNKGSWYFDSPVDTASKYETYVSTELVNWVDQHYSTIKKRSGRAITGLSMGGHGALYLASKHPNTFGAAGSMSGGVDIRPFPDNWNIKDVLGSYADHPDNWEKNTVINMTGLLKQASLYLIIDCGVSDFFNKVNGALHEKLLEQNIKHDFISRPGEHNWEYWNNAIAYQLLFMSRFFNESQP